MKQNIFIALRLTVTCIFIFCGAYTLLIWSIAQATPQKGNAETVSVNNRVVGYVLEGQKFTQDKYFQGRPSAAGYDATAGSGSNKGPSNPGYLQSVQDNIDSFLVHNPGINKKDIPSDMVTASASGLDPDISPEAAYIQVARIARQRNISPGEIKTLIDAHIEKPFLGLLGPSKINVLQLNIALDELK